jgi:hypothetical protein
VLRANEIISFRNFSQAGKGKKKKEKLEKTKRIEGYSCTYLMPVAVLRLVCLPTSEKRKKKKRERRATKKKK